MRVVLLIALSAILLGCSDKVGDTVADPSKMSDALEARASEIEEKADMAVVAAEREAGAELAALREQNQPSDPSEAEGAPTP